MRTTLMKTSVAAIAALAIGAGVAVSTTAPAEAAPPTTWNHGGLYGHNGSYGHGGDYGHGGYWGHGGGWGPAVGLGIVGGVIAGAAIANSGSYYGSEPAYGYGDPCVQAQPMYDSWGRYVGNRMVNTCY